MRRDRRSQVKKLTMPWDLYSMRLVYMLLQQFSRIFYHNSFHSDFLSKYIWLLLGTMQRNASFHVFILFWYQALLMVTGVMCGLWLVVVTNDRCASQLVSRIVTVSGSKSGWPKLCWYTIERTLVMVETKGWEIQWQKYLKNYICLLSQFLTNF